MINLDLIPLDSYTNYENEWYQVYVTDPFNDMLYIRKECGDIIPLVSNVDIYDPAQLAREYPEVLV